MIITFFAPRFFIFLAAKTTSLRDIICKPLIFSASMRFGVIMVERGINPVLKDSKASGSRSFPPLPADRIGSSTTGTSHLFNNPLRV